MHKSKSCWRHNSLNHLMSPLLRHRQMHTAHTAVFTKVTQQSLDVELMRFIQHNKMYLCLCPIMMGQKHKIQNMFHWHIHLQTNYKHYITLGSWNVLEHKRYAEFTLIYRVLCSNGTLCDSILYVRDKNISWWVNLGREVGLSFNTNTSNQAST